MSSLSERMGRIKSKDTGPELTLRRALWSKGVRYRLSTDSLPGKPDIIFPGQRVAVFVDGDYWHGHQWQKRNLTSLEGQFKHNASKEYWLCKIRKNMQRDCRVSSTLKAQGWNVLRFWESDVTANTERCVQRIMAAVSNPMKPYPASDACDKTVAEFFAGIGLMRLGLESQGWSVAFANDIDPQKYEMYAAHFGADPPELFVLGDVHKIPGANVPSVTLATASFPCNDLSLAGARAGLAGRQSSAFWGFVRVLTEMGKRRPPIVLLENVVGFLTSHDGADFESALAALNELGYATDALVVDATHFVPQSRQRLFVVGVRTETNHCSVGPLPITDVRPKLLVDFILAHPNINWQIRNLPTLPLLNKDLSDVLEDMPEDSPVWWSDERVQYMLNQMSPKHRQAIDNAIASDSVSYGTVFRRVRKGRSMAELRTDGIAGCLRTPRGGSGRQILVQAGHGRCSVRLLTPRECARLMGADGYVINVPLNQALFGFGDAVCVPVVEWIAKYYLNPLVCELLRVDLSHDV